MLKQGRTSMTIIQALFQALFAGGLLIVYANFAGILAGGGNLSPLKVV